MSEVAITSESQEGSAATMPELRFDAMMQRFSGTDFERPAERFFPGQSVAELMNRAASLFDMRAAETRAAETRAAHQEALYAVCKRAIDIFISLTAVLFLSPIIVIAGITVKLYDGGPFLFSQIRVGKNGREFRCFKFRSMIVNAEALQSALIDQNEHSDQRTFKIMNDSRITLPGRILRRLSIDELPQLINVLRGDMSIVGPRPPLPSEVTLYSAYDFQRLAVKPGLTCIWQVSGRSRLAFPSQVKMDLEYIRSRSVTTDIGIILKTIPAVLSGDGAA